MRINLPSRVYDGIYDLDFFKRVVARYGRQYSYGWKANRETEYDQGHWNVPIAIQSKEQTNDLTPILKQKDPDLANFWSFLQECVIGTRKLYRLYINGYTYGTDGFLHCDDTYLAKQYGDQSPIRETVMAYLNQDWNADWGGETAIFNSQREIVLSVLPRYGRIIAFDGHKLHAARPLSRSCSVLRQVLVIKTLQPDTDTPKNNIDWLYDLTINLKHSGKTFFEHLIRTSLILRQMNAPQHVIDAGMFHSIYGTEFYRSKINISRDNVVQRIGPVAELLVREFCMTQNRFDVFVDCFKATKEDMYRDLLMIEYANIIEQRGICEKTEIIKQLVFS